MGDNVNPTCPVLDELLKNVLITSRQDPWRQSFTLCLGNKDGGIPCERPRIKTRAETARVLVTHFSSLPECGRDACFYDKVSQFLDIAYCWQHHPPVKKRLNSWRFARGDLEEGIGGEEDKSDENNVSIISDPAGDSVSTTRSSMPSLNSQLDTDPSLTSPCDTQVTTPDVSYLTNQIGTIEISKAPETLTTIEPLATEDVHNGSTGSPKITLPEPETAEAPLEEKPPLSLEQIPSEQVFDAEIRRMKTELLQREQDEEKVEWCMGYYAKCPEKSKLLHMMFLNFSDEDMVPGSVLVTKNRFGSKEVVAVHDEAQLSGGKGFGNSDIVYQSAKSFIGASRVVDLVNETFARHSKDIAVHDVLPEREVIQAVRIWTDFVELLPAFIDGSLGQEGTGVADMAVQVSPNEVVQWLDKLERGLSGMKENGEVRGSRTVRNLSPQSVMALQELQKGMSMAGWGLRKMGMSVIELIYQQLRRTSSKEKNADTNDLAAVEDKGDSNLSPSETSTPTQRPLTPQAQQKSSEGIITRAKSKFYRKCKNVAASISSPKRSGDTVDEKVDDGDIYLMALLVGILLMCNVTELKEMGAWEEPAGSDSGLTVMDRFFASIKKFDPRLDAIV